MDRIYLDLSNCAGGLLSRVDCQGRTEDEIKIYWDTHIKERKLSRELDSQSHRSLWLPHNGSTTLSSPFADDHEILASRSPRTADITDFFQHDQSESSPIQPTASENEEHGDLNRDLCIFST